MTNEEARGVLGDVRAYLASRASLDNEKIAGHSYVDICNAIKTLEQQPSLKDRLEKEYLVESLTEDLQKLYAKIETIKRKIDEMTEIHSDGEFYIKNVDAKWIIGKYLYSAEMIGGGEDEEKVSD